MRWTEKDFMFLWVGEGLQIGVGTVWNGLCKAWWGMRLRAREFRVNGDSLEDHEVECSGIRHKL